MPARAAASATSPGRPRCVGFMRGAITSLAAFALLAGPTLAADPEWHAVHPDAYEGRPAEVTLNPQLTNEISTAVDVTIYGFWSEEIVGPDLQTYNRYSVPGLDRVRQVGAPDLPAVRVNIASSTTGDILLLDETIVSLQQQFAFANKPAPYFTEGVDGSDEFDPTWDPGPGDTEGSEPAWAFDNSIYGMGTIYPQTPLETQYPPDPILGMVRGVTAVAYPMTWKSNSGKLTVKAVTTYRWAVDGGAAQPGLLTKFKAKQAAIQFVNWQELGGLYVPNPTEYHARYLIIAESDLWETMDPFVTFKKLQGYQVAMTSAPRDVDAIRQVIASWYSLGDPGYDHFVLLAGDVDRIPQQLYFTNGTSVYTDDIYGCVGQADESKEVSVGRLSFDNTQHLFTMLNKIMDYERHAFASDDYEEVLLVAHEEGAPGKYVGSHTKVATASYASNPLFYTLFGNNGVDNSDVSDIINDDVGLVAYRGHGSTSTWSKWSTTGDSFHKNNVGDDLINFFHPVVAWSFSCTNSNLGFDPTGTKDSIGEVWMEVSAGAVASYGASRTTGTAQNHLLNETLFDVVYDQGVTTHAHAIEVAEAAVWAQWPENSDPYAYVLLGDPSMRIRRGSSKLLTLALPGQISLDAPPAELNAKLLQGSGNISLGLVSVYKPSFLVDGPDEMLGAYWIANGADVDLPLTLVTPGTLFVTTMDEEGNQSTQEIEITMGAAWSDLGHGMQGIEGPPRLAGTGTLQGGSPWSLLLAHARKNQTAWLCVGVSKVELPFKGGVLVPDVNAPGFVLPLPTGPDGNIPITSTWPDGVPGGIGFVFQYWIQDSFGPAGFVASNAVVGTTPP